MNTQNQTPIRPLSPEELKARREQGHRHSGLVEDDGMRHLERALEATHEQPYQPGAKPPVERERFGQDMATHEVHWNNNLFGTVTIGINSHGFGKQQVLDRFTTVVPIGLHGRPDSITFSIKREVNAGVKMFRSQMNAPVDCSEGEMLPLTFPIAWQQNDSGKWMPSTIKGQRDADLMFLDTTGIGDSRKGALVVLEISVSTRHGRFYLGFQRVFAGQIVRTTAEKAGSIGLETVQVEQHIGSVVALTPENAYPGSNFFRNFSHLANGIVTAAIKLEASRPLSMCVLAHWQQDKQPLSAELAKNGWLGASVCWFNATIGFGSVYTDDGQIAMAHFKAVEDKNGNELWRQNAYPILTPMRRVAVRLRKSPGKPNPEAYAIRPL